MASVDILKDEPMKVNLVDKARARAHISDELARAVLAEFFCTAFLLFGGGCVNVQYVLAPRNEKSIKWIDVTIGWGLSLFFAVCIGHRISGAHLNPAVSLFQLTQGKISPIRFIIFAMAQNVGAFIGSFICFLVYYDAINLYDGGIRQVTGPNATAGIFATYPSPNLSILGGCVDQVVGTAVLCIGIASIVDKRNRIPPFMQPAFIGLILVLIGMALGSNCGYAVNPARDFGPRLFTLAVGYGWEVFTYDEYRWFWIPIICPMFGAVAGAWMYEAFIGFHMPDEPETIFQRGLHQFPPVDKFKYAKETSKGRELLRVKDTPTPAARPTRYLKSARR